MMLSLFFFCRLLTETVKQSQDAWGGSSDWSEVEVSSDVVLENRYTV